VKVNVQVISALDQLITRFHSAPAAYQAAALSIMDQVASYLYQRVYQNLSGQVLAVRSGKLRASLRKEVAQNAGNITARVYSDGSVPYSWIQEKGGKTSPHDIVVREAKALRFLMQGNIRFAAWVHHPGSDIPESMYIRSVMIEERTDVIRMVRNAMKGVM
jgi:hypothetical protein